MPEITPVPKSTRRLPPQPGEVIDRSRIFTFTFDGQEIAAHPGDTIGSALAAAGVGMISRSFKYHRPRGLLCNAGHCPNCLVQVGDEPNVRACRRPALAGLEVRSQNARPSLDFDALSLTELASPLLPVGFYYKTFSWPAFLWPAYERVLRSAAGLGEIGQNEPAERYDKQYLHADVAVIGGGPAGLSAAVAAAQQNARVLLFDENPDLGGHLRFAGPRWTDTLLDLLVAVEEQEGLTTYAGAAVLGWWEDNWLAAVQGTRFYKIRARTVIVATGAIEQPLVFTNNDLPGVMLGSAAQRLLRLHAVAPGRRAVVVTANDDGWAVAADLLDSGITLMGLVEQRPGSAAPPALFGRLADAGVPLLFRHTIQAAAGGNRVSRAIVAPLGEQGQVVTGAAKMLDCDLIAVSAGWAPAAGLPAQAAGNWLPAGAYAAGRVTGAHDVETQLADGRLAGLRAAAHLGLVDVAIGHRAAVPFQRSDAQTLKRPSPPFDVPGPGKQFVCFCEDVTRKDLETAIAEGYDSMELLKRYSTIAMGPCQGKLCSANAARICARITGRNLAGTGATTARPPVTPVKLGNLAGLPMEPVQVTPIHDWHLARGARMMTAGLWLRPEYFTDPTSEVHAVRQRVGLIDVSTLGKLHVSGPGAADFLEKIYVNKWKDLAVGRARYGVLCNDEGVVLDDGVAVRLAEDEWYTTTTSSGAGAVYEMLQWWLQSGWGQGVHLANVTEAFAAFNLAGPQARSVLERVAGEKVSNAAFPYLHARQMAVSGVPCRVLRIGFTGELSYEIHCPAGYGLYLWEALIAAGQPFGIVPVGVEAQRVLRLEKSHIIVGQDTDALSDPIAADMAWAVKLDKADFLGQRPLRRIADHGPAQKLVGFRMADRRIVPAEGVQAVRKRADGKLESIGWVTSSRYSPTLGQAIGLCWLPADLAGQRGAAFTIRVDGKLAEAQIHHGPFYDPDGYRLRM